MRANVYGAPASLPLVFAAVLLAAGCAAPEPVIEPPAPSQMASGSLEVFAKLYGYMPTGIAISQEGRVFLCFPRWEDAMVYTVGELLPDGKVEPFPGLGYNQPDDVDPGRSLFSVQSVAVDAMNRLWLLDTGRIRWAPAVPGAPKLVCVDLFRNEVVKTIPMPPEAAPPDTYLNDVRFDLREGEEGTAYITDSGRGAILVVDIASGRVRRRLDGHESTQPVDMQMVVEGEVFGRQPEPGVPPEPLRVAADGIALSPDGATLYYCPLSSRRLYAVPTAALRNERTTEEELAGQVRDLGRKPAVDGMICDDRGRLYLSAFEHAAIIRRLPGGAFETVAWDPRLLWPDTFAIDAQGWLYVTANQLNRQPEFSGGQDRRRRPFLVLRTQIGAGPVSLK
jgi:sugar lactone lactonase YvrE